MMRTFTFLLLTVLLAGCSRYHSRAQGPFAPKKEPPPPYGTVAPGGATNRPIANQSPLGIASADPTPPLPPEERSLIPPKARGVEPVGGVEPATDNPNALPPLKRRPKPEPLPSPFAPKEPVAPKTPRVDTSGPPNPSAKDLTQLKELLASAIDAWKAIDTYEGTLTRRELSPKGQMNSEVLLFQFRREPMAVFTRNISGGGKGREMVYNPGKHGDKMYVMLGEGDHKLFKAGFVAPPVSPDDPKVTEKARHSVRDVGFGNAIDKLNAALASVEAGKAPADTLTYQGGITRDEFASPLIGVTRKLRPGDDKHLPGGGTRHYFFDMKASSPSYGMPVLIITTDAAGKEVEYYLFEKMKSPAKLTDADFNPARLGKK